VTTAPPVYTCPYCRLRSDATAVSCPNCGAPVDVREVRSDSGWIEQPPIRDMARIQMGRSSAQVEGTYVPVADFGLHPDDWIYFSHHVLLWTEPTVRLDRMPLSGGWNRTFAGLPLVMMRAAGPGHVALSADAPGEVVAVPLPPGGAVEVREHAFLAATGSIAYSWRNPDLWWRTQNGDDTETHYAIGRAIDQFTATEAGLLLLHAPGNTFVRDLSPGESICVQPRSLLYKDPMVGMHLHFEHPAGASGVGGYRHIWVRLSGPGRIAVQSVYEQVEDDRRRVVGGSPATHQHW
jgi:uncharacterized protein (AIM24 family)